VLPSQLPMLARSMLCFVFASSVIVGECSLFFLESSPFCLEFEGEKNGVN